MKESSPVHRFARMALAAAALLVLAACSNGALPDVNEAPALAPQASGSFSSGSLLRGSVEGKFEGVGLGSTDHELTLRVDGVLWYECVNRKGNYAPGQFAFIAEASTILDPATIDRNGRFREHAPLHAGHSLPTDFEPCKNNWSVNTYPISYEDSDKAGQPILYLQIAGVDGGPGRVWAELTPDGATAPSDTFEWECKKDPPPTMPLLTFVEEIEGDEIVCDVVDGPR